MTGIDGKSITGISNGFETDPSFIESKATGGSFAGKQGLYFKSKDNMVATSESDITVVWADVDSATAFGFAGAVATMVTMLAF